MSGKSFVIGMGMGVAAGMAIGAMMPGKKKTKSSSGKIIKVLGDIVDNITDMMA